MAFGDDGSLGRGTPWVMESGASADAVRPAPLTAATSATARPVIAERPAGFERDVMVMLDGDEPSGQRQPIGKDLLTFC